VSVRFHSYTFILIELVSSQFMNLRGIILPDIYEIQFLDTTISPYPDLREVDQFHD
jgi:hypothetical protein